MAVKLIKGKKAIFFTLIAISLVAAMALLYTPNPAAEINPGRFGTEARVKSTNALVADIKETYLESALKVSSHKAMIALTEHMKSNNQFLADFQGSFSEAVMMGTIDGQPSSTMRGNTMPEWLERISNVSRGTFNVEINFTAHNVKAYHAEPWKVDVQLNVSFSASTETAVWNMTEHIAAAQISIEGLEDPYYSVNTVGLYIKKVNRTNTTSAKWDASSVQNHLKWETYVHFPDSKAPSFIMRFENRSMNSSCCGIEGLANPQKLQSIGFERHQMESYADYLFWSHKFANNCTQLYNITGLWDEFRYFKLDFEHVTRYNITSQDAVRNC